PPSVPPAARRTEKEWRGRCAWSPCLTLRFLRRLPLQVLRRLLLLVDALAARRVEDGVAEERLRGPRRAAAAEVLLEPLQVRRVVEDHLVPARPVAGVR